MNFVRLASIQSTTQVVVIKNFYPKTDGPLESRRARLRKKMTLPCQHSRHQDSLTTCVYPP